MKPPPPPVTELTTEPGQSPWVSAAALWPIVVLAAYLALATLPVLVALLR